MLRMKVRRSQIQLVLRLQLLRHLRDRGAIAGPKSGINHQRCVPAYDNADVGEAHDSPNMVGHLYGVFAENRLVLRIGGCQEAKRQEGSEDLHAVSCTTFCDSRVAEQSVFSGST